jgi:hypothetical protein
MTLQSTLDTLQRDATLAAGIVATFAPMAPEVEALVVGCLAMISAIKRSIVGVAKNADGTPMTDAQLTTHMVAAGNTNAAIIIAAALAMAEDAKLASTT